MSVSYGLRPFDKLFIKDGRPLSLEDDSAASGLFPPPPSVLFGALRTAALAKAGAKPGESSDPIHGGRLTGFAFSAVRGRKQQLYFPCPRDVVRTKMDKPTSPGAEEQALPLPPRRLHLRPVAQNQLTSYPIPGGQLLSDTAPQVEAVGGYVSAVGLAAYLAGKTLNNEHLLAPEQLYEAEPKLGIGLDYTSGATKEGLLYTMAMQRLRPGVELAVRTQGFGELTPVLRLGAEARAATATDLPDLTWPAVSPQTGRRITLYLATPAVFKQGWLPDFLNAETMQGEAAGAKLRLLAASVGRYQTLGGWDIVARRPKPMRKAVPAGSVYHFAVEEGDFDAAALHGRALATAYAHAGRADSPAPQQATYEQQGFGIAYLGTGPADLPH